MDHEQRAEEVRDATVALIKATRAEYLGNGGDALTHWDQLQSRMMKACRQTATAEAFVTTLRKGLRLTAANSRSSEAAMRFAAALDADAAMWIAHVQSEIGFYIARARRECDEERDAREVARMADAMTEVSDGE